MPYSLEKVDENDAALRRPTDRQMSLTVKSDSASVSAARCMRRVRRY
jgi:hypothetical protein